MITRVEKGWNIQYFEGEEPVGPEWTAWSKIKPSRWANEHRPTETAKYLIYSPNDLRRDDLINYGPEGRELK